MPSNFSNPSELQTVWCHKMIVAAYRRAKSGRHSRTCDLILNLVLRLEGGEMFSATARRLMSDLHGLQIGAYAYGCFLPTRFPRAVTIGRYASIGPDVQIFRRNHPLDRLSLHPFFYNPQLGISGTDAIETVPLSVGADVWIGARALILPGCRSIGVGAVVGAGAVVNRDVPAFAVVVGNPARVVKMRFADAICARILESRWWERSLSDVRRFLPAMQIPLKPTHPLLVGAWGDPRDDVPS
jgi:acetyltransferase-like isoleucine patch superfamily enzyme